MMAELDEALDNYNKKFDDTFPMFAMMCKPQNEVIKIINDCIEKETDVYDLGYLDLDDIY